MCVTKQCYGNIAFLDIGRVLQKIILRILIIRVYYRSITHFVAALVEKNPWKGDIRGGITGNSGNAFLLRSTFSRVH